MKTFLAMCAHCETRWTWSAEKQTWIGNWNQ